MVCVCVWRSLDKFLSTQLCLSPPFYLFPFFELHCIISFSPFSLLNVEAILPSCSRTYPSTYITSQPSQFCLLHLRFQILVMNFLWFETSEGPQPVRVVNQHTVIPDIIMLAIPACGSVSPDMDWGCRRYFWLTWRKPTLGGCRLTCWGCACPVQCSLHCTCTCTCFTEPNLLFCSKKETKPDWYHLAQLWVANSFAQTSLSNVLYGYQTNSWQPVSAVSAERLWYQWDHLSQRQKVDFFCSFLFNLLCPSNINTPMIELCKNKYRAMSYNPLGKRIWSRMWQFVIGHGLFLEC